MKFLRQLRALLRKGRLDAEMAEEMRHHVELQTELNLKAGMNPEDARYAALRQFGNVASVQEQAREQRGWVWLEQFWQDGRYAFRQLGRTPGFTAIVVLTLALGIGGTTAIFSMVNTVILNPVGGPEPERMVQIGQPALGNSNAFAGVQAPVVNALYDRNEQFERLAWSYACNLERQAGEFINMETGAYVSSNFFSTLHGQPFLGRGFLPEDEGTVAGGSMTQDTAIVLSYDWWQSQWGGDRQIIGRVVEMSGRHFTIVGVMPSHFRFPATNTQYWLPAKRPDDSSSGRFGFSPTILVYGQLKPAVTPAQAQAALDMLSTQLMEEHPVGSIYGDMWRQNQRKLSVSLRPLSVALQDGGDWAQLRQTLLGLFAAVSFVLFIVCANVANLALARLERRQHELAVRAAIGAGRARLIRQLFTENLILAFLGGIAGLLVTSGALKVLATMNRMPRLRPIEIDGQLLEVTLTISFVAALFFGLAPIWRGGNVRENALLADGGQNATGGRKNSHYRNALVVMQVAITVVLLTGAGLMLLSVSRILRVDPGFDPQDVLLVEASLPFRKYGYGAPDQRDAVKLTTALIGQLHEGFRALPGVKAVGTQQASLAQAIHLPNRQTPVIVRHVRVGFDDHDVFKAMRVPLLAGRHFTSSDVARPEAVIINEAMARQYWPGENVLGKKFGAGDAPVSVAFEVIGVLGDAKISSYVSEVTPIIYHPFGAEWSKLRMVSSDPLQFVIRTAVDPGAIIPRIRHELKLAEPALKTPVFKVAKQVLYDSTLAQRTYRNYLGLFALLGLMLSSLGIYGVLAFSVARRTREIGIRMAIGADAHEVRVMVLKQGGKLIATGILTGLIAAMGVMRLLQSQLFNVDPLDPIAMTGATTLLGVVGLFACWLPARRAAKVDPVVALRAE